MPANVTLFILPVNAPDKLPTVGVPPTPTPGLVWQDWLQQAARAGPRRPGSHVQNGATVEEDLLQLKRADSVSVLSVCVSH